MKHFLVSDDVGVPIYFDHPDGRMICLPLVTTQAVMLENFNDKFTAMQCGGLVCVLLRQDDITFAAVSNEGDSEHHLRNELRILREILLMIFGPQILETSYRKTINLMKSQPLIQKLMDTACWNNKQLQSFLVQGIEYCEMNEGTKRKCDNFLKSAMDNLPSSLHGLVFVGNKVLCLQSKSKNFELSSSDLLMLTMYFMGHFQPHVKYMQETHIPKADYTDHQTVVESLRQRKLVPDYSIERDEDDDSDGFVSAHSEEWEEESLYISKSDINDSDQSLFLDADIMPLFDSISKILVNSEYEIDYIRSGLQNLIIYCVNILGNKLPSSAIPVVKLLNEMTTSGISPEFQDELQTRLVQEILNLAGCLDDTSYKHSENALFQIAKQFEEQNGIMHNEESVHSDTVKALLRIVFGNPKLQAEKIARGQAELSTESQLPDLSTIEMKDESMEIESISYHKLIANDNNINANNAINDSNSNMNDNNNNSNKYDRQKDTNRTEKHEKGKEQEESENLSTDKLVDITNDNSAENNREEGTSNTSNIASKESNSSYFVPKEPPNEPVWATLHLRAPKYQPFFVYCAPLAPEITFIIINKNATATQEEIEQLNSVHQTLTANFDNYADFLKIKAKAHINIAPYLHQLPGLIHFIFVDKTSDVVIAPTIRALNGQQHPLDEHTSERIASMLKKKVWEMCNQAQQQLARGHCSVLMKSGDTQFSYRLWLEDAEGFEVPIEHTNTQPYNLNNSYYKELMKQTPRAVKCFELYALYVGILSVNIIANHERKLMNLLNPNHKQ